jgi:hypothetical protein
MPKAKLEAPEHIVYLKEVDNGKDTFVVGENVWIDGRRKARNGSNVIKSIVHNTNSDTLFVNVFCENRGRGQSHSFEPDRLVKRNIRKKKG